MRHYKFFKSFYLLIGILLSFVLLNCISFPIFYKAGISARDIFDILFYSVSAIIVFGTVLMLYVPTFRKQKKITRELFLYKLSWISEMLFICGASGSVLGIVLALNNIAYNPAHGIDFTSMLGADFEVSFLSFSYGIFGGFSFKILYFFSKSNILFENIDIYKTTDQKFRIQALVGVIGAILINCLAFYSEIDDVLSPFISSTLFIDVWRSFGFDSSFLFSYLHLELLLIIGLIAFFIYPNKIQSGSFVFIKSSIFFNNQLDSKENLITDLNYIRSVKKILAALGVLLLCITPISILARTGEPIQMIIDPNLILFNIFLGTSKSFIFLLFIILIVNMFEGNLVQKIMILHEELIDGDRNFIFKYILPPFVLWYLILIVK